MQSQLKIGFCRKQESSVWTHFKYDASLNTSKCTVMKEDGELCGKEYSGKFTSNLKAHLVAKHESVYKKCQMDDESLRNEKRKASSTPSSSESSSGSSRAVGQVRTKGCNLQCKQLDPLGLHFNYIVSGTDVDV